LTANITARQIVMVPVQELIPYARNSRTHDEAQVAQIAASIREWGFTNPLLIDAERGVIAGHGRLLAARQLGLTEVPTICCDGWTEAQTRAYVIADNKLALNAGWDVELLRVELEDLECFGFDLDLTGFDPDEINALQPEVLNPGLTDEDAVPEPPETPVTVLGDIWVLGRHRLMCGDSTAIDAVESLMDGQSADMVFTDPPYNIDYGNIKHPKFKVRAIENDNMSRSDFADFCAAFAACIKIVCNGCVYVFGPPGPDGRIMFSALDSALHCSTTIVWNKDQFTLGRGKYQNKYEPCWFGWNVSGAAFINDRKITNVWDFPRPRDSKLHPTMKPVVLVENALGHASNVGGVVLDLFGGSGTTIIAAEKMARVARMMEIDPKYCDVIIKRWQDFTGMQAVLESTGLTFDEVNHARQKTEADQAENSGREPRPQTA
jgi:DNA modification methylase